jgi:5-methyltetrahydrofolate--homocysteine methyltransferase
MQEMQEIRELLLKGDREKLISVVQRALADNCSADDILYQGLVPGMEVVGQKMANEEIFIPEVLLSAIAMKAVLDVLRPSLNQEKLAEAKTVVMGTVYGDVHDLGKELVISMLKGAGFKVIDLGVNVPVAKFVDTVKSEKPAVLGMSAMLTTTMQVMEKVIQLLIDAGIRSNVKILVGGAPVNEDWASEIGADAYGKDCIEAVRKARQLISR